LIPRPAFVHLYLAALLFAAPASAASPEPGKELQLTTAKLPLLLDAIPRDDRASRWELANLALEVMNETYREALDASTEERLTQQKRRQKLARWQNATLSLIRGLDERRQALLAGSDFSIYADAQQQIIVTVDGHPIVLAGLSRGDDRLVQNIVVERFCAFNACPSLEAQETQAPEPPRIGASRWQIQQNRPPVFVVEGLLQCRFDDLQDRHRNMQLCQDTAREIARLRHTLATAKHRGTPIDWSIVATSRQVDDRGLRLLLDRQGTWVMLQLPTLANLSEMDWRAVIESSRAASEGGEATVTTLDGRQLRSK
jgi:hypothetical protein